jgi:acetyl-CoA carboxylase biotin carboxylase subunit
MGDKSLARRTVAAAGVPTVPGSPGPIETLDEALAFAKKAGYPVILKASAGGGGRGMRIARDERELSGAFDTARAEAETAFGNAEVYLEKYLEEPRHIEFQVFGDSHGNLRHIGERECSIQRRHQKLIEEAPSTALDADLRQRMGEAAVAAARSVSYTNAGTIEFLLDGQGHFYFMEMNTRLQVEHAVTEEVTGIDMVKEQIAVAAGEPLSFAATSSPARHAIEFRINAEDDPFTPSPGRITPSIPGGPGARGHGGVSGLLIPALRFADREAHRLRADSRSHLARPARSFFVIGRQTTGHAPEGSRRPDFVEGRLSTRFVEVRAGVVTKAERLRSRSRSRSRVGNDFSFRP